MNDSVFDTEQKVLARTEQAFLRKILFKNKRRATCCVCCHKYPIEFLVAAHIKKRSRCTEEKRNFRHIVAPMCKFGCDDLYEKGYIGVVEGKVSIFRYPIDCPTVQERLDRLEGLDCLAWREETSPYFRWHENHFQA